MSSTRNMYSLSHKDGDKTRNAVPNLEWIKAPFDVSEGCPMGRTRTIGEIQQYETEAFDKVWLMRTHPCDEYPDIEASRQTNVKRILDMYPDIPKNGYTDWECGYWNGIMAALRWALGDEKNFLDT